MITVQKFFLAIAMLDIHAYLDPITDRVYLSRHVVFVELSFLAKDHACFQLPSKVSTSFDPPFAPTVRVVTQIINKA
jgi:hypothetical protein